MSSGPGQVSVRVVLGGGFGLLRARPAAVMIWGLIYGAANVALSFAIRAGLRLQPDPTPGTGAGAAPPMGAGLLVSLLFLALFLILLTAAMRSVLRPSEPGFAWLRFGMDELRQIGLSLFLMILFYVGLFIAAIATALVAGLLIASFGIGLALYLVAGLATAALVALIAWLGVRLSLAFPLTLLRGSITISESWRLTRGRFWPLFGGLLLIYILLTILSLGAGALAMSDYLAVLARDGFTLRSVQEASRIQLAHQLGPIDLKMVGGWVMTGLAVGLSIALQGGALAAAARALVDVRAEMRETFG